MIVGARNSHKGRTEPPGSGQLDVDTLACTVTFAGASVELRPREFALLAHLARDPMRVHEKQELLREVWGYRLPARTRTVDSHASRLRRKLADAGAEGWVCATFGIGYRLTPNTHTYSRRASALETTRQRKEIR